MISLPPSLFLAVKYLKPRRSFLSVISALSILGVLLGVAVLIIVLSVMSGFDRVWTEKILAFDAHVTVSGREGIRDPERCGRVASGLPGVIGWAPFIQSPVVIRSGESIMTPVLRGIDPSRERSVSMIPHYVVAGTFDLRDRDALIGRELALRLHVGLGDTLLINAPEHFLTADEIHLPEEFTVAGIFDVGMYDYDAGFILTSIEAAQELFDLDDAVQGLKIMTLDPYRALPVARRLQEALGPSFAVRSWMELNQQLFGALRVEKNMMFFLLIFITVVAAFGITNTLIVTAVQKTRETGLLKAVGFPTATIIRTYLWQGWIYGFLGTASGIAVGLLVLRYRNDLMWWLSDRFQMEIFPEAIYRLSEIPAVTSAVDVALVALSVMLICTLAGAVPAYRAAKLLPAEALRHD